MTQVSAKLVKELRDRTGLGMMECKKKHLKKQAVISNLRLIICVNQVKQKLPKKAGNIAADGAIIIAQGEGKALLLEVNCQTDFVAKDENFTAFANKVAKLALENNTTDVAAIAQLPYGDGSTVEEARVALVQKKSVRIFKFAVLK